MNELAHPSYHYTRKRTSSKTFSIISIPLTMSLLGRKWPAPVGMSRVSVGIGILLLTWNTAQPMWPFYTAGKPLPLPIHSPVRFTTMNIDLLPLDRPMDEARYRANWCELGLVILYSVNSFATTLMKSMCTLLRSPGIIYRISGAFAIHAMEIW